MTDKKTDSTDKNFDLNHFDQADETESFYADKLFAEAEQPEAAEKADPFAAFEHEKKEPIIIPQETESLADIKMTAPKLEPDKQQKIPDNDLEQTVIAAPITDSPSSELPGDQRSGTRSVTVFAILAMLVAAIAVWMNPGANNDSGEANPSKARPAEHVQPAENGQIQRLEARISSLEQHSSQQREKFNQQIKGLQQQLSSLTSQLAKQTRRQQPTRHAATPMTKRNTSAHRPVTAQVSPTSNAEWVINLASVGSKLAASKALSRYKTQGIPAEIYSTVVRGKTWYRLRIVGFASKQEANTQKHYLASKHGIKDAWIQKP